jgi:glycerol-3-phosphate acyltransferase PlsY
MSSNVWLVLIAVAAYALGSIPFAYLVTRRMIGSDINQAGSGNVGAMNAFRVIRTGKSTKTGFVGFAVTFLGDLAKGILAVFLVRWLSFLDYDTSLAFIVASFFAVLGHNYSAFLKFKRGGRGLSTIGGVVMALNPASFFLGLATMLATTFLVHMFLIGKINWSKPSDVFSVAGSEIIGRVVGLAFVLVVIYYFSPDVFLPTLAGMVLVFIKHVDRVRAYATELR